MASLYPYIPPLSQWRAWEHAAYSKYRLTGRVLDLGCGDGSYFRLLWPRIVDAVGVDLDPVVAEHAKQSGVYRTVHVTPAHRVPEVSETFNSVFANCSLEHMDSLDAVLDEIHRCLKPGGSLLCSVITDRFMQWCLLPSLFATAGFDEAARDIERDFMAYHHLANVFPLGEWQQRLANAGLALEKYVPILPRVSSSLFSLMDNLWHVKRKCGGEMGDIFFPIIAANQRFPLGFRKIISGLLDMETNWEDGSGAVLMARKTG